MSTPQPSEETPPSSTVPTAAAAPVSTSIAPGVPSYRTPLGIAAGFFALALLTLAGVLLVQVMLNSRGESPKDKDALKSEDDLKPKTTNALFETPEKIWTGVFALAGGLVLASVSIYGLIGALPADSGEQERRVRLMAATAGSALGAALAAIGFVLTLLWVDVLVDWLDARTMERYWPVMTSLLLFLIGLGLVFVSVQAIRIYERDIVALRRIVYGVNLAVSTLLVLVGLLAVNLFVSLKLPNRLDTTEAGLFTLQQPTREYLQNLTEDVTAYAISTEEAGSNWAVDLRRLLTSCQEAQPRYFKVKWISPSISKQEIEQLLKQDPQLDFRDFGVFLSTGPGGKSSFVRASELVGRMEGEDQQQRGRPVFKGESALVSGLLALTDESDKVVYFTQGHGELSISRQPVGKVGGALRTADDVRTAISKLRFEVKPLTFDDKTRSVPNDAAVVVVADPQVPMTAGTVAALNAYMTTPRPNGKKGKLVLLSGPKKAPTGGIVDIGLDQFLTQFGVGLGKEFAYFAPLEQPPIPAEIAWAVVDRRMVQSRNPIIMAVGDTGGVLFPRSQEVTIAANAPPPYRQLPVAYTFPQRPRWYETEPLTSSPDAAWLAIQRNPALRRARKYEENPVDAVGVAVLDETSKGRLVVFGSGDAFADSSDEGIRNNGFLLATTINWLSERPAAAGIISKPPGEYVFNRDMSFTNGFLLPVCATMLVIVALGLGVWVVRRK